MLPNPSTAAGASGHADGAVPRTFTLGNGLKIVVIPDRRSPIVTHMLWYRNGSADDPPGKSGIAHFLEHLMFKGTTRRPAGAFSTWLASVGGEENAFTSWNFTAYHQRVPREHLAACMAYEADRMGNLVFDEGVFETERAVILEERGMVADTDPEALLGEAVAHAASPAHPAGRPIIGWRHEIEGLTRADAIAYYRSFYTPGNATLVVAGDAEPDAVLEAAEAAYGPIPAGSGESGRRRPVQDPPGRGHRQVTLRDANVREPRLMRLHMVPAPAAAEAGEAEALDLLAFLLGGDETSALHTRLVLELGIATQASASYLRGFFTERARFYIAGTPAPARTPEELDRAVDALFDDLLRTGFAGGDIERAKTQFLAGTFYARDNQVALARWYGMALSTGLTLGEITAWQARVEAVSADDLASALARLDRRSAVSGYLVPAGA